MAEKELLIPQIKCLYIYIYLIWSQFVVKKSATSWAAWPWAICRPKGPWLGLVNFKEFCDFLRTNWYKNWWNHPIGPWFFKLGDGKSHQLLDGSVSTSCFNDHHFEADGGSHTRGKKSRQRQCLEGNDLGMIHLRWRYDFPTKGRSAGHNFR